MAYRRTVRSAIDALLHERERLGLQRDHVFCTDMADGPFVEENGRRYLSFCSNDYLGLSQDARWQKMVAESFAAYRPSSSASRLAGGWDRLSAQAEAAYAAYFGYEDCLFFPSGYQGNLSLMTGLIRKGQPVLADRRIHASAAHALVASGCSLYPYAHNDMDHLERRLKALQSDWQPVVVTESLFSMDGTLTSASALAALKKQYGFFLIADEAHAAGCLGSGGRGVFSEAKGTADVVLCTLGKGCGFFGAFALLPKGFASALQNLASAVMHSTALPPAHASACLKLLDFLPDLEPERKKLAANARFFREELASCGIPFQGEAHIVSVPAGPEASAHKLASQLKQAGVLVLAARYPTVPYGKALLRFSITARHDKPLLKKTVQLLASLRKDCGI